MKNVLPQQKHNAFTLIELLVVIAIIAILAAILFPVFGQAREKARGVACLSNEKQMGTALIMYSQDFDEGFPTWSEYYYAYYAIAPPLTAKFPDNVTHYWDAVLLPYVKSGAPQLVDNSGVWHCPDSDQKTKVRSYGMSMGFTYDTDPTSIYYYRYMTQPQIEAPALCAFVGDGGSAGRLGRTYDYQGYYEHFVVPQPYTRDAPWRHQDGANYVFCDGHAKYRKADEIYPHPVPPSTAYSTSNQAAFCSFARNFAAKANERLYWQGRSQALGGTCTLN